MVDTIARSKGRIQANVIAERACVTPKFALKILRKLVAEGILVVYRGPLGGYELAKPMNEITIHQVLQAIEGPLVLNRCLLEHMTCTRVHDKNCPYHNMFATLTNYINDQLISVSFADVINAGK
jgi:Rrf2 family protein